MDRLTFETVRVQAENGVCRIQLHRPESGNAINATLIHELRQVLAGCESNASVVVLSGGSESFCVGADFREVAGADGAAAVRHNHSRELYELWLRLATGPYVSVVRARGTVNAGGMGFVAASDIVLADESARFSLSELLFGLYPACVLPFLIRRVGFQRANYLTLMTQTFTAQQALTWGLVDACEANADALLHRHLQRLRCLSKPAIRRYKAYVSELRGTPHDCMSAALAGNREIFSDPQVLGGIARYVESGVFPWETA